MQQPPTLYSRTEAARNYFVDQLVDNVVSVIDKQLKQFEDGKKVKKYLKDLNELKLAVGQKIQQLKQSLDLAKALRDATNMEELLILVQQKG